MVRETHDKIDFMRSQLDFNEGQVLQWHQELEQRVYIDTSSVDINTSWAEEMTKHVEMVMSAAYRYCSILDHRMMELEGAEKLMKGNKIEEKRRDKLFLERFSEVAAKFEQVSFERAMFLAKTIQKEEKS